MQRYSKVLILAAALACPSLALAQNNPDTTDMRDIQPGKTDIMVPDVAPDRLGTGNTTPPTVSEGSGMNNGSMNNGSMNNGSMNNGTSTNPPMGNNAGTVDGPIDNTYPNNNIRAQPEGAESSSFNTGNVSVNAGVDYTNAYFFRGYNQEDSRVIIQPYATINVGVGELGGNAVSVYAGVWNSLHSQPSGGTNVFYETDFFGGANITLKPVTIGVVYTVYTSIANAFGNTQEIGATIAFDDADISAKLGIPFALNPTAGYFFEVANSATTEHQYLQFGIKPTVYTLFKGTDNQIELSVPIVFGTSPKGYYTEANGSNSFFGFGSVGIAASVPLPIPKSYGAWALTGSVQYLRLFADSVESANNGDKDQFIGTAGISFTY